MRRTRFVEQILRQDETEFSLGALASVFPPGLITSAIASAGKQAKRLRKLPPDLVLWLVVGMGLFRALSIPSVLARIVGVLGMAVSWGLKELPHSTAISEARDRLGWQVVRTIFARLAAALAKKHEAENLWRGLKPRALDGCTFLVPDSKANDAGFGRPGTSRGGAKSGFPQLRAVLVLGVFTHLVTQLIFAPYRQSELKTAEQLARQLKRGTLLLMDRLYYSFAWLAALKARRVHVVVRAKTGKRALKPKTIRRLADGSKLAKLVAPRALRNKHPSLPDEIVVRVVTYRAKGFRAITVVTTLLSETYPAAEIGALYHDRWEVELGCREIKTYQTATQVTFRSKTPSRVLQEAYGLFTAYNCVRALMAEAAAQKAVEPRRLSFIACLERIRAALIAYSGTQAGYEALLDSLCCCVLPPRRTGRRVPRAVKIKMSKWPRKRPGVKAVARTRSRR